MTPRAIVFGFSSFFRADENYNDVDLLVVHDDNNKPSCHLAIRCKQHLVDAIPGAHVTMLSENEERLLNFTRSSNAIELGLVDACSRDADIDRIVVALRECMKARRR